MKIALDLDDVLMDYMSALRSFHNNTYGTSLAKEDIKTFYFAQVWGGTDDEAFKKVQLFTYGIYFDNMKPLAGAVKGVRFLEKEHDLIVVTSRFIPQAKTFVQLNRYFPGIFPESKVYFSRNAYTKLGHSCKTKADICVDEGAGILIEDSLDYANECSSNGINVLLLNQPWNENKEIHDKVKRVYSWEEIIYRHIQPKSFSRMERSSL